MRLRELDVWMLLAALLIAAIGVSALASASGPQSALAGRQAIWIGIGLAGLFLACAIDYRRWVESAWLLYALNLAALVFVLLFGHRVNGSKSWVAFGSVSLQPSEFMKIATILVIARLLGDARRDSVDLPRMLRLGAIVAVPMGLILLQPDMGTALTFGAVLGASLAVAGLGRRTWAALAVAGVLASGLGWTYALKDYQKERIRTFLSPETDARALGYQIIQSRIAIGAGGWLGKGYASGTQSQLNFIPEKHTDFVFPVVAEEWGFLGSLTVVGLYAALLLRGLRAAGEARDASGTYLALGIMALVATHVAINLGMVTGLLPTIGIPLPLMSYGGSSVVSTLTGIGLVLGVRMRRIANG